MTARDFKIANHCFVNSYSSQKVLSMPKVLHKVIALKSWIMYYIIIYYYHYSLLLLFVVLVLLLFLLLLKPVCT